VLLLLLLLLLRVITVGSFVVEFSFGGYFWITFWMHRTDITGSTFVYYRYAVNNDIFYRYLNAELEAAASCFR